MLLCCMCVLVYVVGSGYDFNHLPVTIGSLCSTVCILSDYKNQMRELHRYGTYMNS